MIGFKMGVIAVLVLVAGLLVWMTIHSIQSNAVAEERLDNLTNQIETRERIDVQVRNSPSDAQSAIELLRRRQNP